jgi:hypothetical protein
MVIAVFDKSWIHITLKSSSMTEQTPANVSFDVFPNVVQSKWGPSHPPPPSLLLEQALNCFGCHRLQNDGEYRSVSWHRMRIDLWQQLGSLKENSLTKS